MKRISLLGAVLGMLAYVVTADAGLIVNETGADLLTNPNVTFYRSVPRTQGDSLIFDTHRSDRWEKLFSVDLISPGEIANSSPVTRIHVSMNLTRLTNDWDPYFLIGDGNVLTGPVVSDNQVTATVRSGTAWLYDFSDSGDVATQIATPPKVIIYDAGFPDIGESLDVDLFFVLGEFSNTVSVAFLEGAGQPFRTSSLVLDRDAGLEFVMLGENIAEQYQLNAISIRSSVPEPSIIALLTVGIAGIGFTRKKAA